MKKAVLLVVDDREENLFLLRELVSEYLPHRCDVITTLSPEEGLAIAARRNIDGAILDVQMPGIDGVEMCRRMKANPASAHVPVVLVTAHKSPISLRVRGLEAGADDFISRPIDNVEMVAKIKVMLRIKQAEDRLREANARLEEKVAERTQALCKSEERFRNIVESTSDWIWEVDADAVYTYTSVQNESIFGYSVDEILGKTPFDFMPPDEAERMSGLFGEIIRDKRTFRDLENWHITRDGQRKCLLTSGMPILSEDGEFLGYRGTYTNITERKEAEEKHEQLEAQLCQAQKMEAVGQLAGGVAHDFNNMLQAILGYGEMAMGECETESKIHGDIEQMLKAAVRATILVRQLLAFSRRQVLEMKDVNLNDVVADVMKMLHRLLGEHIALNVNAGDDLGIVRADPGQIEQILMNLCVNARDAMPEGGTIIIGTENVQIDEVFCANFPWAKPGRYVLLSVTDTGCGMDKKTLASVFEPFFTTKGVGEGTGLGLSMVYGLVKQHNGMVHVYSEVDKGTVFKIYLPLTERSAAVENGRIESPVVGGTETILLAEDEEMIRKLSKTILERAGYTVLTACDGEEAIRVFEEHAEKIDLALLDVVMPKLGGHAVLKRIREVRPGIQVLFASGYSMNAIHTNFIIDEDLPLIQKPCQRDDLLRRVREVLDA